MGCFKLHFSVCIIIMFVLQGDIVSFPVKYSEEKKRQQPKANKVISHVEHERFSQQSFDM